MQPPVTMQVGRVLLLTLAVCVFTPVQGDALRFVPGKGGEREEGGTHGGVGRGLDWGKRYGGGLLEPEVEDTLRNTGQLLSFASYYGDHMVLQQAPRAAGLWGYADPKTVGLVIIVKVMTPDDKLVQNVTSTIKKGTSQQATWFVQLKPVSKGGPYNITVTVDKMSAVITDVMFGDVWLCSGQSNMQFTVPQLMPDDLKKELASVHLYPGVRLFTVGRTYSDVPLQDLKSVVQPWAVASEESLNGKPWGYFSAVCWLYGRRLYETLGYPIGLVDADYGGTPVEAWSSPDALKACDLKENSKHADSKLDDTFEVAMNNSALWNAMIHPLLNMTIYGAIWYQGEADSGRGNYNCTFPAMIADWRQKFNQASTGQTNVQFPFGFVQLAPWHNNSSLIGGFPSLRWQQTANQGFVPNSILPNTFMAVAMDLPDFESPYTPIHPRYKETVADRLYLGGLSIAYGVKGLKFQGPMTSAFYVNIGKPFTSVRMEFDNGTTPLRVLNTDGFEVCCLKDNTTWCPELSPSWAPAPIVAHDMSSVMVSAEACSESWIMGLRYAWRESPCPYRRCAVYSAENLIPVVSFVSNGIFGSTLKGPSWRRIDIKTLK